MSLTKLEVTKKVAKIVVGWSTAWTVGNVIANNVTPESKFRKAEAAVGGVVIGSIVADHAEDHINKKIDDLVAHFKGEKEDVKLNLVV